MIIRVREFDWQMGEIISGRLEIKREQKPAGEIEVEQIQGWAERGVG